MRLCQDSGFIDLVKVLEQPAFLLGRNAEVIFGNRRFDQQLGQSHKAFFSDSFQARLGGAYQADFAAFVAQCRMPNCDGERQCKVVIENGDDAFPFLVSALVRDAKVVAYLGQADPTAGMHLKENNETAQLAEKLRLAIDAADIGVWEFDPNTGMAHWDDRMLEIYGLDDGQNDRSGTLWGTYLHPDDKADMIAYSEECVQKGLEFQHDYRIVQPDGKVRHIRSRAGHVPIPGAQPKLIGVNIDVTEDYLRAKEVEQAKIQLQYDSRHDALTGLANRRLLDVATIALRTNENHAAGYAVLHLDLDHFKHVNDTLGHAAGDLVLCAVSQRLKDVVGDAGLVCRIGGDEFAVLFETAPSRKEIDGICNHIIQSVSDPIDYEGNRCKIGVSIGCAFGHVTVQESREIFLCADEALYSAKAAGRNCYRIHPTP